MLVPGVTIDQRIKTVHRIVVIIKDLSRRAEKDKIMDEPLSGIADIQSLPLEGNHSSAPTLEVLQVGLEVHNSVEGCSRNLVPESLYRSHEELPESKTRDAELLNLH